MTHRTAVLADFDSYLAAEYSSADLKSVEGRELELSDRRARLQLFPYSVVLQVAYPELDYANRWCWQQFGPAHGPCREVQSEYPTCNFSDAHNHEGTWLTHWLAKTDYNFGYNEWCFSKLSDKNRFLEFVPEVNWGERYPK